MDVPPDAESMNIEDGVLSTLMPVEASVKPYSLLRVACRHRIRVTSSVHDSLTNGDEACVRGIK